MFLVKSCCEEFLPQNSNTLKIGTLIEYRQTEIEQILDKEEGYFQINFDLQEKYIERELFNFLNYSHLSHLEANINNLSIFDNYDDFIKVTYQGKYVWKNLNRFIFCISKVEDITSAQTIFSNYDKYWYISLFKKNMLVSLIKDALFNEVVHQLSSGIQVFTQPINNISTLRITAHCQDIIYTDRYLYLDNKNLDLNKNTILGIFKDIKYIKPVEFKQECEFRIVFDFYNGNEQLFPIISNIIIKDNISDHIKTHVF